MLLSKLVEGARMADSTAETGENQPAIPQDQ